MEDTLWINQFQEVYERGTQAWQNGQRSPQTMFSPEDEAFLKTIGCTAQELFDFIEDALQDGEPDYDTVLAVQAIRRDYFLNEMGGQWPDKTFPMDELPPKSEEVDGIRWLPRLMKKARLKLRGEMPADLMYGCGGDRPFLQRMNMTLPQFLQLVRDMGSDHRGIIEVVKLSASLDPLRK